jgi:hypothetical protein
MPKPLIKLSRFGNIVELVRFSKPLVLGGKRFNFGRRKRSKSTFKQLQNLYRVKRRVRRSVSIVTQMMGPPALVTFTYAWVDGQPVLDMQKSIEDWRKFTRRLKRAYPGVAFIRVPERQKSGNVHFHAAMFGLPQNLPCYTKPGFGSWSKKRVHDCPKNRQCERRLRAIKKLWPHGTVDAEIARKPEAVGAYISNYLTKDDPDWSTFGNHLATTNDVMRKKIAAARQAGVYWELSSFSSPVAVASTLDEMQDRMILRKQRSFETRWLGDATFQVYFVESEKALDERNGDETIE